MVFHLVELDFKIHIVLLLNVDDKVDADNCHKAKEDAKDYGKIEVQDLRTLLLEEEVLC